MVEKEYSVSEAVRLIGVESHVLRYWEDELSLRIRRSAQGHRVYSEENIDTLRRVKELKEKGLQLKAIRLLLDGSGCLEFGASVRERGFAEQVRELVGESRDAWTDSAGTVRGTGGTASETGSSAGRTGGTADENDGIAGGAERAADGTEILCGEIVPAGEPEPMRQFEQLLRRMMEEVVSEQNGKLEESIAARIRDELEDFYLQYDRIVREAAATMEEEKRAGILRRVFRKLLHREQ